MLYEDNYLAHYGIQGMRWGIRRFQDEDGRLTEEGKKRYGETKSDTKNILEKAKVDRDKARLNYEKKASRLLFTTDIAVHRAKKKLYKAEKKLMKIQDIYNKRPDDEAIEELTNKAQLSKPDKRDEDLKKDYDRIKNEIKKNGASSWLKKSIHDGDLNKLSDYIESKHSKILDDWWKDRYSTYDKSVSEQHDLQRQYAKKLAKAMDMPLNDQTYYLLERFYLTWDD